MLHIKITGLDALINRKLDEREKREREKELRETIEKGTKAWSDVDDPAQWVDELRGNDGDA